MIGIAIGFAILMPISVPKSVIIQHHAAHRDPQTGDFKWNDEKESK